MLLNYAPDSPFPDDIADFVQAVLDDEGLERWLFGLESLQPARRGACIAIVANRMSAAGESAGMVRAVQSLESPAMLRAVVEAVKENM